MKTAEQLTQVFNDNFVAYFRSHAAHINIVGRNFRSDHKLLQGVYERRQAQIDVIGELLRTLNEYMPCDIFDILDSSEVKPTRIEGSSDELLESVLENLETLKGCYEELIATANTEGYDEISNYAQDQVLDIAKSIWMLKSTLE
jgi:DNA-binding ferritin-like protein